MLSEEMKYEVSSFLEKLKQNIMRTAIYYKKERTLYLFVSKNTAEYKNCYSLTQAKQLVKAHYGRITEKQFRNTFTLANKMKGNTAENFAGLLEKRIDMVVYRLNLAPSIFAARQLVSHKHVKLNGKKVNIPSLRVKEGDVIELKDSSKQIVICAESAQKLERSIPNYLSLDADSMSGTFVRTPSISDIPYPFEADFNKIVELYSR